MAPRAFLEEVVAFAKKHHLIVAYDNAYSEMFYDEPPLSFFEIPAAKDVGIEFHSLSKDVQHDGWRIGWVCGNAEMTKDWRLLKTALTPALSRRSRKPVLPRLKIPRPSRSSKI